MLAKFEILNPKHETNPKYECSNVQNNTGYHLRYKGFGHFNFGNLKIVSKLGPRPQGGESVGPISIFGFRINSILCSLWSIPFRLDCRCF